MAAIGLILAARPIVEAENLLLGKEGGGRRKEESIHHRLHMHHEKKNISKLIELC